jgi:hypothetical protein
MANRNVARKRHDALNGVFGKRLSDDRVGLDELDVIDHRFHDARDENWDVVAD